jgi:hypothetical protein
MANFHSQSQRYEAAEVESIILDLQEELQDEQECRESHDSSSADKLIAAQEFVAVNAGHISSQLTRLKKLDFDIRGLVTENEALELSDIEYQRAITSPEYTKIAEDIAALFAIADNLDHFLVQKGRKGRPPMN